MTAIKQLFTNNPGLKLLSLLLAFALWFLVTNFDDPAVSVRFYNIPVTIRNANTITSQGKVYEVLDGTDMISSVTIVAPRSVADTFTKDNVIATADMNNLSSLDTLSINVSTNKYFNRVESITPSIDTVRLAIEDSKTKTLALSANTVGTLAEGSIIGQVSTEQNVLRITGPASAVDQVKTASVSVDVTGFTENIDTDADIHLYDADGNEVINSSIRCNINAVRVTVSILQTKRVPVRVQVSGTPAEGYLYSGETEINPDTVLVAGRGATFQNMEELVLNDSSLFDLTGRESSLETSVNIRSMLPAGITLGDPDFNGQVSVTAGVVRAVNRELEIPVSQLQVINVPEGMRANIQTTDNDEDGIGDGLVKAGFNGLPAVMDALDASDITGTIDVTELIQRLGVEKPAEGAYTVSVIFAPPQGVYQVDEVKVFVNLSEE